MTDLRPCPCCGQQPGQKVGPPALARCINEACPRRQIAAVTLEQWNAQRDRKDLPIIYSAPMIRALIREATEPGTGKTMTRRLLYGLRKIPKKRKMNHTMLQDYPPVITSGPDHFPTNHGPDEFFTLIGWHQVQVGDRLWTRENALYWKDRSNKKCKVAAYQADGYELEPGEVWTPSIHMPRWASRLTLTVTSTKIERLKDIQHNEADAIAEGVERHEEYAPCWKRYARLEGDAPGPQLTVATSARVSFQSLWVMLHGQASWRENPWVVAIGFKVAMANIDSEEAAA